MKLMIRNQQVFREKWKDSFRVKLGSILPTMIWMESGMVHMDGGWMMWVGWRILMGSLVYKWGGWYRLDHGY